MSSVINGNGVVADGYKFTLELSDEQGNSKRELPLHPTDFQHAAYATHFDALQNGVCSSYDPPIDAARIEPRFEDGNSTSTRTVGFRVRVPTPDGEEHHCDFPPTYFSSRISRVRAELLRSGEMASDEKLLYQLSAFLDDASGGDLPPAISLGPASFHVPISEASREEFGSAEAWDSPAPQDVPVLIDRTVINDVVQESHQSPKREVGGFLLGRLMRDASSNEMFVLVSGFVAGGETTDSHAASVTFKPESFARAREMIALRGAGEQVLGWYHSHPFRLCSECHDELVPICINTKILFYSLDDIALQEQTFNQPFQVGLLAAVEPKVEEHLGHLPVRLFGWRKGEVVSRGFHVIDVAGAY